MVGIHSATLQSRPALIDRARKDEMSGEFDEIRARLEVISDDLADLAISRLRDSIDAGGHEFPVDEKRLTRARRAVDKAVNLLSEPDDTFD